MLKQFLLLLVIGSLASCASNPRATQQPTGFLERTLTVDGTTYPYVVYLPKEYAADTERWPCILSLHGSGESGIDGKKPMHRGIGAALETKPAEWPFVVILPQKPDARRQWEEFDAPVMAMLDQTRREFRIDQRRIYLTGYSQGGHGTWVFGANHPGTFAAMAAMCGYVASSHENQPDSTEAGSLAIKLKSIPQRAYHGLNDDVVPWSHTQLMVESLKSVGAEVESFLYPGVDHNCWDKAFNESGLAAWFLKHRK